MRFRGPQPRVSCFIFYKPKPRDLEFIFRRQAVLVDQSWQE